LKDEYKNLPGPEIGKLRKTGVEVSETFQVSNFAFLGDTTVEVFQKSPSLVKDVPVIFIECTLLDLADENKAIERGHIHWKQLKPFVVDNKETTFVLMHWSRKHSDEDIISYFEKEGENGQIPANIVLWLDSGVTVKQKS